jgi:enoyl-CoA hydratase
VDHLQSDPVIVRMEDRSEHCRVAVIAVNNGKRLNSLNSALMRELIGRIENLGADPNLRVVVLTGAGSKSFIGGADIFELRGLDSKSARDFLTLIHKVSDALRMLPVPVIARVNGYCLGAGLELAAACDMRIATEDSIFGMPEVKVGLPSVIEAALLPTLIGWGKTRVLCYTGENITAKQALAWGLVEKIVARDKLDEGVEEWISAIIAAGPEAIRLQKELIGYWEKMSVADAVQEGVRTIGKAYETDEPLRMLSARIDALRDRKR